MLAAIARLRIDRFVTAIEKNVLEPMEPIVRGCAQSPCSGPGKPYSLELSWQNQHSQQRIRRSSDHLREPPQTAAAEIVAPGFRDPMLGAQRSALRDHGMRPEHYAHMLEGRKAGWQE